MWVADTSRYEEDEWRTWYEKKKNEHVRPINTEWHVHTIYLSCFAVIISGLVCVCATSDPQTQTHRGADKQRRRDGSGLRHRPEENTPWSRKLNSTTRALTTHSPQDPTGCERVNLFTSDHRTREGERGGERERGRNIKVPGSTSSVRSYDYGIIKDLVTAPRASESGGICILRPLLITFQTALELDNHSG